MTTLRTACALILTAACLAACNGHGGESRAIPRRPAYPRLQLPDTAMTLETQAPLQFMVNSHAIASWPRPDWLDIAYPTIGATIHVTFTPVTPATVDDVMHNRMERLMLNAGAGITHQAEFTNSHGFDIYMARGEGSTTPVQFLATDGRNMVVSGAAVMPGITASTPTDSIGPAVDALYRDILTAMQSLKP